MEINKEVLNQRLADLQRQEEKIKADFSAIQGAKQLVMNLLNHLETEVKQIEEKL